MKNWLDTRKLEPDGSGGMISWNEDLMKIESEVMVIWTMRDRDSGGSDKRWWCDLVTVEVDRMNRRRGKDTVLERIEGYRSGESCVFYFNFFYYCYILINYNYLLFFIFIFNIKNEKFY